MGSSTKNCLETLQSSQISVEQEPISLVCPESKLNKKELAHFVKKIYDQSKVNKNEDKFQPKLILHEDDKTRSDLSLSEKDEAKLGEQLKQICSKSGRETNLGESALIFDKLADVYRKRSPDKLSLIKSAALYNAALFRSPGSKNMEKNLHQLCSHILELAGSKMSNIGLVSKANEIKEKFKCLRNKVNQKLKIKAQVGGHSGRETLTKRQEELQIFDIKSIQNDISIEYSTLMDEISSYCHRALGKAPCKFSVVGMGSLARRECSPYSDFEHVILLEDIEDDPSYESKIEYFRWFSIIFHVIVINLQETILPSVDIACLRKSPQVHAYWFYDNVTPRGISFDGLLPWANKNPLGRQEFTKTKPFKTELIKPVSKMLKYLSSEEDLKNGYHLADILTKVCFVHGDKDLFERFQNKMYELLESKHTNEIIEEVEEQLKNDFENFAVRSLMLQIRLNKSFNIKRVVYRSTTLFISALGRIYKIRANSCFDIIEKLFEKNLITSNARHKLEYAIALACEVRLRWYMQCERQNDVIENHSDRQSTIETFTSLLGLESTIKYFQIAYSLQCDVSKRFDLKKIHFHSDPQLFNHKIIFGLNCEEETSITITPQKENLFHQRFLDFDECLWKLVQNFEIKHNASNINSFNSKLQVAKSYNEIGDICRGQKRWDDAIEFYEMCICLIKELGDVEQSVQLITMHRDSLYGIGDCIFDTYKHYDAINKYKEAILISENLPQDSECYRWIAASSVVIGRIFIEMKKRGEAIKHFEQSLQIFQSISTEIDCDKDISRILRLMSQCYALLNWEDEAVRFYQRSLEIENQKSRSNSQSVDDDWIGFRTDGITLFRLKKYKEADESFNKSLEISERVSTDKHSDKNISLTLHWKGRCLFALNEYGEALLCFKRCFDIFERVSTDKEMDIDISINFYWIGRCLYGLNRYDEALEKLKKNLEIFERITIDEESDKEIALTLTVIGDCLVQLNRSDEANVYYERAKQYKPQKS